MNWSDVVTLLSVMKGQDDDGFGAVDQVIETQVFANQKSVKSHEYYAAKQSGIQLSYIFELRTAEYDGQTKLRYNGDDYIVERKYDKGEFTELTCKLEGDTHGT